MALFWKKEGKEGGLMDVIRCDEPTYLIWKWRPAGAPAGEATQRENAIRWGSSLRVKDGEVAVFVYRQKDGMQQDFIEGPFDSTIKTANFPVLSSIIGLAYDGGTPFQAEVYFINLAGLIQVKVGVPYFDVFDPRFMDFAVPVAVRGTLSFKIGDYRAFIKLHRLAAFSLDTFQEQIRDAVNKYVKGVVSNIPQEHGIPVMQLERKILQINEIVDAHIKPRLAADFGVAVSALDIGTLDMDKDSEGYASLRRVTQDIASQTTQAQAVVNIKNMADTQAINAENMQETLRVQREELQHAQRMRTDAANFAVHQINQQAAVAQAGAAALGQMGAGGAMNMGGGGTGGGGGGMNPAAMMTGMAMGGAMGGQMAGMMNNMMQGMNQPAAMTPPPAMMPPPVPGMAMTPPPVPSGALFNIASNGQSLGPFDVNTLAQLSQNGQFTAQTQVWKQGMAAWAAAGTVPELAGLFAPPPPPVAQPPPPPPPPPAPPMPPPVPAP